MKSLWLWECYSSYSIANCAQNMLNSGNQNVAFLPWLLMPADSFPRQIQTQFDHAYVGLGKWTLYTPRALTSVPVSSGAGGCSTSHISLYILRCTQAFCAACITVYDWSCGQTTPIRTCWNTECLTLSHHANELYYWDFCKGPYDAIWNVRLNFTR